MKSKGPNSRKNLRRDGVRERTYELAKEALNTDGWVEVEGLQSYDATGVYNVIGRLTAEVAYRNGIMYARIVRRNNGNGLIK